MILSCRSWPQALVGSFSGRFQPPTVRVRYKSYEFLNQPMALRKRLPCQVMRMELNCVYQLLIYMRVCRVEV